MILREQKYIFFMLKCASKQMADFDLVEEYIFVIGYIDFCLY